VRPNAVRGGRINAGGGARYNRDPKMMATKLTEHSGVETGRGAGPDRSAEAPRLVARRRHHRRRPGGRRGREPLAAL